MLDSKPLLQIRGRSFLEYIVHQVMAVKSDTAKIILGHEVDKVLRTFTTALKSSSTWTMIKDVFIPY